MGAAKARGSSLLRNDVEAATLKSCMIADVWARAERESCDGLGDSRKRVRDCGERVRCYGAFYECGRLRVRWFDVRRCYDGYDGRCDDSDGRRCDDRRQYYDGRCDDSGDGVREDDWCEVGR